MNPNNRFEWLGFCVACIYREKDDKQGYCYLTVPELYFKFVWNGLISLGFKPEYSGQYGNNTDFFVILDEGERDVE